MKELKVDLRAVSPASGGEPAALCALDELRRLLSAMDPGISFAFGAGGLCLLIDPALAPVQSPALDDAVKIDVVAGSGVIAGNNPRALLIAVYRFARLLGAQFVRPGKNGELLPRVSLENMSASYSHVASRRHRGICIEGSVSIEAVLDTIEWMPKLGFNTYFVQFFTPYTFFQRWYGREWNPALAPERLTRTLLRGFSARITDAAKRRGLVYQAVGHGWTCEPLGIPGLGWYQVSQTDYPEEVTRRFALVGGKRELWRGVPLNTNLCYTDPSNVELITDAVVSYAAENRSTDVIHFWLADSSNSQCECGECRKKRTADHYIRLLNIIDEKLTAAGLSTRVVFLLYVDLLWPPVEEKLLNPGRFILMFAPISRTYSEHMAATGEGKVLPYKYNALTFPRSVNDAVAHLRAWQAAVPGCDSFLFDYHFMWDYIREPGGMKHAAVLFEDMAGLGELGLNGMVSCQNQRVFNPTGFGMFAMAEALWDATAGFAAVKTEFFSRAFGGCAEPVAAWLDALSGCYPALSVRGERALDAEEFNAAASLCRRWLPALERMALSEEDACRRESLEVLVWHCRLTEANAELFAARAKGEACDALFARLTDIAVGFESAHAPSFDLALYLQTVAGGVGLGRRIGAPDLED